MSKALEYILSRPLAVTREAADLAVAIALRDDDPTREAVRARAGVPLDDTRAAEVRRGGVAVVPVVGPIFRYANLFSALCGGATVSGLARDLTAVLDNPAVRSIVLEVDSPGGEAAGVGELAGMVRDAAAVKPTVAYVSDQGCSAAYWIASAAAEVVVAPSAIVGSIGVVMGYPSGGGPTRRVEFVSSQSPNKRPDVATDAGRAQVQAVADDLAAVFVADVAANRGVTVAKVLADFGRGGVLVGAKAVAAGLADRVGTLEGVLAELAGGKGPMRRGAMARALAPAPAPTADGLAYADALAAEHAIGAADRAAVARRFDAALAADRSDPPPPDRPSRVAALDQEIKAGAPSPERVAHLMRHLGRG